MPIPAVSALPPAPARTMTNDEFIAKADAFVAALTTLRTEINAANDYIAVLAASLGVSSADAELAALAGLVSAADRLPYFTGSGTASLATFTAFARTLVDDVDAPAMRTTLGLGALALLATVNNATWSGTALAVGNGGSGATTAATARSNLGAAVSGANGDITSLTALSTALSIAQGGTGSTSAAAALAALGGQGGITYTAAGAGWYLTFPIGGVNYRLQMANGSSTTVEGSQSITWPVAFGTSCLFVVAGGTIPSASTTNDAFCQIEGTPGTSSVTVRAQAPNGNAISVTPNVIGFGY